MPIEKITIGRFAGRFQGVTRFKHVEVERVLRAVELTTSCQNWTREPENSVADFPAKVCRLCRKPQFVLDYLRPDRATTNRNGDIIWPESDVCAGCHPVGQFELPYNGKLGPIRIPSLTTDGHQPVRWYDHKTSRWKSMTGLRLRMMKRPALVPMRHSIHLSIQPREDRQTDADGERYAG